MRRLKIFLFSTLLVALMAGAATAQTKFTNDKLEYEFDLPSATWRVTSEPDSLHQHLEFIYGDRNDGHLRIRKEIVDAGTSASDLSKRDQDQKFRFKTGYIDGKEEKFAGSLSGVVFSYEYTAGGKAMAGRAYYLQSDNRTIYTLNFTGLRDKLAVIRNQTDQIARTFRLK
ncbi:MAG: hypothetical protein QOF02_432 [Blastocatellia bacterium]|jgi:hypothetical protein|nr:hypothetical protein [Blastocatellia bacterium]